MSDRRRVLIGVLGVLLFLVALAGGLITGALITDYNNLGTLTRVISLIDKNYIDRSNRSDIINGAIKGIVESLGDPYSVYMPPKMYKDLTEQVQGSFGGVGIEIEKNKEHLYVIKPIKGTPAFKAGIRTGDIILKIDGKSAQDMNIDVAKNQIRGPLGTSVTLFIVRNSDEKIHEYRLTREVINVPTVEGKILYGTNIAYISIGQFTAKTDIELGNVLRELGIPMNDSEASKVKGIILDLRDNPGGELEAAVNVADFFVPEGPIVSIEYRTESEKIYRSDKRFINLPLVVLVNGNSASASEIVSGAIKDTKAGILVGTKTFGKGVVQSLYQLQNNAGLKLTTGRYLTPLKHDINKKGIEPDVKVELPNNATKDIQLYNAIEILKN